MANLKGYDMDDIQIIYAEWAAWPYELGSEEYDERYQQAIKDDVPREKMIKEINWQVQNLRTPMGDYRGYLCPTGCHMEKTAADIGRELHDHAVALGQVGGKIGGKSKSAAKVAAARENAKKGGRPKSSKKFTLRNDFHNTEVSVIVKEGEAFSATQQRRVRKALCGVYECRCGTIRGPQDIHVYETWEGRYMIDSVENQDVRQDGALIA